MVKKEDRLAPVEAIKQVTISTMVKLRKNHPITLPRAFIRALKPDQGGSFQTLMICNPKSEIIRFIPTTSSPVFHLVICLKQGTMKPFLQNLGEALINGKVKSLYSLCMCELQERRCILHTWFQFEKEELKGSIEKLMNQIKTLAGVIHVEGNPLSTESGAMDIRP
jgi:hypothetical protein